jgi:hypothetical protein
VTVPEPLEVYGSRKRATFALVASVGLVAGGIVLGLYGDRSDPRVAFAAFLATPLFGFVAALAMTSLIRRQPALTFSSEGVTLARHGIFVPWAAISDVTVEPKTFRGAWMSYDILVFRTASREGVRYVKRWGRLMEALYERSWIGEPYAIPLSAVAPGRDEIVRAAARFHRSASKVAGTDSLRTSPSDSDRAACGSPGAIAAGCASVPE